MLLPKRPFFAIITSLNDRTNIMNNDKIIPALIKVEELLTLDYFKFSSNHRNQSAYGVSFEFLNKLIRVSQVIENGHSSVIGFIVNCESYKQFVYGDLLKAASRNTPALNFKRGNIFEFTENTRLAWTGF